MTVVQKYPAGWRLLHWVVALMVLTLIGVGLWMSSRAGANNFDALTNTLYAWHKAIGFTVLLLMVVRILVKVRLKGPAYPPEMPRKLQMAAKGYHHLMYVLLVLAPLFGWAGVTAYPALITLGGYHLPALPLIPQDQELAVTLFRIHGTLAITLAVMIAGHITMAFIHMIRKDGIFHRMI